MAHNPSKYRLSPKARDDMEAVWLYSLDEWGLKQTERYIDNLTTAFTLLVEHPKTGTHCANIREGYRKYPVLRHVIYYRETRYGVEIIRVLHDRRLASRHL